MADRIVTWCWYCKKEISPGAEVCPHCNMPLTTPKKVIQCQNCGKFLLMSASVCDSCGQSVEKPSLEPPETEESAEDIFASAAAKAHSTGAGASGPRSPLRLILPIALAAAFLAGAFAVGRLIIKPNDPEPSAQPVAGEYCADDAHQWREADCITPKVCTICGKTEGEALGHDFQDNVCTRCGAYDKAFYFTESACARKGEKYVFSGNVKNFSGVPVTGLPVKVELYDKDKKLVASETTVLSPARELLPMESAPWELTFGDWQVKWKYWRVTAAPELPELPS